MSHSCKHEEASFYKEVPSGFIMKMQCGHLIMNHARQVMIKAKAEARKTGKMPLDPFASARFDEDGHDIWEMILKGRERRRQKIKGKGVL